MAQSDEHSFCMQGCVSLIFKRILEVTLGPLHRKEAYDARSTPETEV